MITCSDAVRKLWEYLDGAIGDQDRNAIEEHLDVCKRCCGEAEFAEELRAFLEIDHQKEKMSPQTRDRLTSFLEQI